jgi:AraC-like DNA-binding protein/DNA gyrase inhibitor GyrI
VAARVQDTLDEPWTLASMAALAGYDPYHFAHAFQAVMGQPPLQYMRSLRLERAAYLLAERPERGVLDIALGAGYGSGDAFARAFTRAFGRPPGTFRRQGVRVSRAARPPSGALAHPSVPAPEGLAPSPTVEVAGPFRGVSLASPSFSDEAIGATWVRLYGLVARPSAFHVGSATPPWGWVVPNERREYHCVALDEVGGPSPVARPPLERFFAPARWYARFDFDGDFGALRRSYAWIFAEWLPRSLLCWAYAPLISLFDDGSLYAREFRGAIMRIYVPVERASRGR